MHLPAKDSSYCHQTLPTGIHPIIPAIDTLSSFRNQFDQIPWATGSIKIYPAKEGAYRHRCSEDDGEPEWRVMRSSKGSWRPVAWRVEAVEGPEAVGAQREVPRRLGALAPLLHLVDMLPPNLVALVRVLHQTEDQVLRKLHDETHRRRRSPPPSSPVSLGSAGARRPL